VLIFTAPGLLEQWFPDRIPAWVRADTMQVLELNG
jgi:hypothetical protein